MDPEEGQLVAPAQSRLKLLRGAVGALRRWASERLHLDNLYLVSLLVFLCSLVVLGGWHLLLLYLVWAVTWLQRIFSTK